MVPIINNIRSRGIARLLIGSFTAILIWNILSREIIKERYVIAFLCALGLFGIGQGLAGILVIITKKSYLDLEINWSKQPLIIKIIILIFVPILIWFFIVTIGSILLR